MAKVSKRRKSSKGVSIVKVAGITAFTATALFVIWGYLRVVYDEKHKSTNGVPDNSNDDDNIEASNWEETSEQMDDWLSEKERNDNAIRVQVADTKSFYDSGISSFGADDFTDTLDNEVSDTGVEDISKDNEEYSDELVGEDIASDYITEDVDITRRIVKTIEAVRKKKESKSSAENEGTFISDTLSNLDLVDVEEEPEEEPEELSSQDEVVVDSENSSFKFAVSQADSNMLSTSEFTKITEETYKFDDN